MSFDSFSIWINVLIFAVSAVVVWAAGSRLAGYVDGISEQTGVGQAFVGMLLLGGITSLPEIATVSTASWTGNAPLAINNLLGSASINVLLLAIADIIYGRDALTSTVAQPTTLLQGTLGMVIFAVVSAIVIANDFAVLGIGVGATALLVMCGLAIWLSSRYEHRHVWTAQGGDDQSDDAARDGESKESKQEKLKKQPLRKLVIKTTIVAAFILVAGFFLSQTGDAIAKQTGLGASLVGLVLVGFATSLPELSSITAALRIKRYEMAVGDIFGTNLFNIALIFLADVIYRKEAVLAQAGSFEAVASLLGVVLTGIFVIGLLERRDRTFLRMGYDSLSAIVVYGLGLVLLYVLDQRSGQ